MKIYISIVLWLSVIFNLVSLGVGIAVEGKPKVGLYSKKHIAIPFVSFILYAIAAYFLERI